MLVTRHSLGERKLPLRVLVADDNAVNRRLLAAILEKGGHSVTLAENGVEALSALHDAEFDIVLMDVQMPEMDGYEATARIRAEETRTGKHVPIVALTAHALKQDRDACLAAGMDDYLSKPVRAADLLDMVARMGGGTKEPPPVPASRPAPRPAVDIEDVLARVEGDRELLGELVTLFTMEAPATLVDIHRSVDAGDAGGLERAAHRLRGALLNFGASAAADTAQELEQMGRSGRLEESSSRLSVLDREFEAFVRGLKAMLTS